MDDVGAFWGAAVVYVAHFVFFFLVFLGRGGGVAGELGKVSVRFWLCGWMVG